MTEKEKEKNMLVADETLLAPAWTHKQEGWYYDPEVLVVMAGVLSKYLWPDSGEDIANDSRDGERLIMEASSIFIKENNPADPEHWETRLFLEDIEAFGARVAEAISSAWINEQYAYGHETLADRMQSIVPLCPHCGRSL